MWSRSITLSSLNILHAISSETCAFSLQGNADVRLLLEGVNQLQSGQCQAGIQAHRKPARLHRRQRQPVCSGRQYGGRDRRRLLQDGRNITINSGTIMAAGGSENSGVSSVEQNDPYVTVESWMLRAILAQEQAHRMRSRDRRRRPRRWSKYNDKRRYGHSEWGRRRQRHRRQRTTVSLSRSTTGRGQHQADYMERASAAVTTATAKILRSTAVWLWRKAETKRRASAAEQGETAAI